MNTAAWTFFDHRNSSLPLKQFYIYYGLSQTAVKTDESILTLFYNGAGHKFSPFLIHKGVSSSISWHSVELQNKDHAIAPEELEFIKFNLHYTIPDLLRHTRYMTLFGLLGFVFISAIISFYRKIRSLENTIGTLSSQPPRKSR